MATTKTKTAQNAVPQIDEAIDTGMKVAENVVKSNTEAAQKGFETIVSMGREAIDNACKAGGEVKGFEKVADLPKANFEAMVEAGNAFVKGIDVMNGRMFEIARVQINEGVETQKAIFGAKTFQEAMEIQQDFVKKSMDRAMHDGIEFSNAWMKVATEAGEPIGRRVSDMIAEAGQKAA
ncbi:MAG: phasin family protein [Rhodospirillales bacterium]|nr:phasin family protein [Rhodospirillales bacterium]